MERSKVYRRHPLHSLELTFSSFSLLPPLNFSNGPSSEVSLLFSSSYLGYHSPADAVYH
ncbi:MAG: hypothetical protein QXF40_00945 [Metallosphaera sp.]